MGMTTISVLESVAEHHRDRPALRWKEDGEWRTLSWGQTRDRVMDAASGLIRLGFEAGDGMVILAPNRPEWLMANFAAIAAGGVPSGLYTTATPEQCAYVTEHCEATVAVLENEACLHQIAGAREQLKGIVLMDGPTQEADCLTWDELVASGADPDLKTELAARISALEEDQVCTLIYTSGTTGSPKGVMLSHTNLLWTARQITEPFGLDHSHRGLSYLPLSHVAEQVISIYGPLQIGGCVAFAESLDALPENLREIRPTFFFGVPRVWEKIQGAMEAAGATSGGVKRALVRWARGVGLASAYAVQRGEEPVRGFQLADRLVYRKVRQRLGFDRVSHFVTSAAPISVSTLEFFMSLGVPILEVYGMTECTGPGTLSTPERYCIGSAGFALPGTEIKLMEDGEICMRGSHVFLGYYKSREATREALDEDGWLHSGDIGTMDEDGFLRIVDRKREIIITSGGKNIAPVPIELQLKSIQGVALAVVIGDRRKFLSTLLTLDPDQMMVVAQRLGLEIGTVEEAVANEAIRSYLADEVERVNSKLAAFETIKRFAVLSDQLSVEAETLTPTLKLRRKNIAEVYRDEIEEMYAE